MRRWLNVGLWLGHRLQRWPSRNPALGQRLVSVGVFSSIDHVLRVNGWPETKSVRVLFIGTVDKSETKHGVYQQP